MIVNNLDRFSITTINQKKKKKKKHEYSINIGLNLYSFINIRELYQITHINSVEFDFTKLRLQNRMTLKNI